MIQSNLDLVKNFTVTFKQPIREFLTEGSKEERLLRAKLMVEELCEVLVELGVAAKIESNGTHSQVLLRAVKEDNEIDLPKLAKELADLEYVVLGSYPTFGIPAEQVFKTVHWSNMSKLDHFGNPIFNSDGKVVKGPNYRPADIKALFRKLGYFKEIQLPLDLEGG